MEHLIRFAEKKDTAQIMEYIDKNWRKGHILSRDRILFEWQYGYGNNNKLNIVLGLDENNEIQGMLGFVPYDNSNEKDIALALWKANPSTGFLGIKLIKYLIDNEPHREVVCPGINMRTTSKIYEHLGMKVGQMSQWYRLRDVESFAIAGIVDNTIPKCKANNPRRELVELKTMEAFKEIFNGDNEIYQKSVPFKSYSYVEYRYYNHPSYHYSLYALKNNTDKADSVFVFRVQECNGSRAMRLIDCIGDTRNLCLITASIDDLLVKYDCEYADYYVAGIDDEVLFCAGWRKVESEGNIIPEYFAPFEQRKVDIFYSSSCPGSVLFKGDGDQDRPS